MDSRGDIEVETLLKVVLVLIVVWIGLEVLDAFTDILEFLLAPLQPFLGLLLVVLIVLWLLDRI